MEATKRLYDADPYLTECDARVLSEQVRGYDGLYQVILDQTVFYPTGGGQPHDIGYISDKRVLDVYKEEGVIYHILEDSLNRVEEVVARIDWDRRFDHMQQHAGQHILSRAFELIAEAETVGFHLGEEIVTIDLAIEAVNEEMVLEAETLANQIVTENRAIAKEQVKTSNISEEIKNKIPELGDYVRIIDVKGFDSCACAGTHPHTTAEIGIIKVLGWEKYKQKTRLSFVCGNRTLQALRHFQKEIYQTAAILKTNWTDVQSSVKRVLEEKSGYEKQVQALNEELLSYEMEKWKKEARFYKSFYLVEKIFEDRDFNQMKKLAVEITQSASFVVIFVNKTSDKVQFLLHRSDDIEIPMNDCLKLGLEWIDGKGGGNQKMAQGGGQNVENMNKAIENIRDGIFSSCR